MARRWSLRNRLLVALVALAGALFATSAAQNYFAYRKASGELFDDSMQETAGLIMQLVQHEIAEHGQMLGIELLRAETRPGPYQFRFQVWTPDMQAGVLSAELPTTPYVPFDTEGFAWATINGETWRAYSTWNAAHTLQVQVVQRQQLRVAQDRQALVRLAVSCIVLLVAASALMWWVLDAGIRPLRETAARVGERDEHDLGPVDDTDAPREVLPLLAALNRLLQRISTVLAAERRFTADAAHELRTPLAAIRANAQVLVAARDAPERERTGRDLLASVDRSTRLVDQLLALARADQPMARARFRDLDLATVAADELRMQRAMAGRSGVGLAGSFEPAPMQGDPTLLAALLRNLLDNAIRYGRSGGSVRVTTGVAVEGVELVVEDDGPGIAPAEREQVFERFHRMADSTGSGSGLGLSIARRIVELHGGRIAIEDPVSGVGTRLRAIFPAGR